MKFAFGARMVVLACVSTKCQLPLSRFLKLVSSGLSLWGRVRISLVLANEQLSSGGIVCRYFFNRVFGFGFFSK